MDPNPGEEGVANEDMEEEVRVEDECEEAPEREEAEENALMQRPKNQAGKDGEARDGKETVPLHAEDRARLVQIARETLSEQMNAEPALTLLALLGEEPAGLRQHGRRCPRCRS